MTRGRTTTLLELLLTSGVDVMTSMPEVSALLKKLIPSFSLSMIRVDEGCAPREHYSEYFDEASHQLFASAGPAIATNTTDPAAFGVLLRNRNPIGALIDNRPEYLAGATYQHLFQRNGIHHCLDLALRDATGPIGILGIFREQNARPFNRGDVVVARSIYEHLVHACAQRGGGAIFDEIDTALVVADDQGRIAWSSGAARRWLETAAVAEDRAPLIEGGALPAAIAELVRRLVRKRSRAVGARPHHDETPSTMVVPTAGGRLRLRAYPLQDPDGDSTRYVGVQIGLEMDRAVRVLIALDQTSLSPQQCRIAFAMWQGRSNAEIASLIGVTANTLKSYQKDMYARLAVSGASEVRQVLDQQARAVSLDLLRHRPRDAKRRSPLSPRSGSRGGRA